MDKFIAKSDNEDFEASPPRVPDRDGGFVSDRKNRVYPALTFWVVMNVDYMSVADFETKLSQIMLKAGLDIDHCTLVKSRKKTSALDAYTAPLCQVIKDHKRAYARDFMGKPFYRLSATAVCEYSGVHIDPDNIESQPYLEDLPLTQEFSKRIVRMWITASCPQLVASKIRQALTNMRYADLFYDIVDEESSSAKSAESTKSNVLPLHCPSNKTLVVIRYVQRTMHKLNYALYRGNIYKKPSESKFAYVYTATVESFLNTLLANKKIAEVLISQLQQVNVILSNRECSIIKQIQIDHNLIDVLPTGTCFNIGEKRFVCGPFGESDIEKITPRAFVHYTYKERVIPYPKRFSDGIENGFGRGTDECKDFLRKCYQLVLHGKFPQKTKKLCLIGHSDSGKTSWFQPFQAITPLPFIAAMTREGQISAHKPSPDSEICYMNEWSDGLGSEDAKKILEDGLQSIPQKHKSAQVFAYKSGFLLPPTEDALFW